MGETEVVPVGVVAAVLVLVERGATGVGAMLATFPPVVVAAVGAVVEVEAEAAAEVDAEGTTATAGEVVEAELLREPPITPNPKSNASVSRARPSSTPSTQHQGLQSGDSTVFGS